MIPTIHTNYFPHIHLTAAPNPTIFIDNENDFVIKTGLAGTQNTRMLLQGNSGADSYAELRVYGESNTAWILLSYHSGAAHIGSKPEGAGPLDFNEDAYSDVYFFSGSTTGEVREIRVYGFVTGDQSRYLQLGLDSTTANQALFTNLSSYKFDGILKADRLDIGSPTDTYAINIQGSGVQRISVESSNNNANITLKEGAASKKWNIRATSAAGYGLLEFRDADASSMYGRFNRYYPAFELAFQVELRMWADAYGADVFKIEFDTVNGIWIQNFEESDGDGISFQLKGGAEIFLNCGPESTGGTFRDMDIGAQGHIYVYSDLLVAEGYQMWVPTDIIHLGDTNTWIRFATDTIYLRGGGTDFIRLSAALAQKSLRLGLGADIDISLESSAYVSIFIQGSDGYVGIGTVSPVFGLDVAQTARFSNSTQLGHGTTNYAEFSSDGEFQLYGTATRFEIETITFGEMKLRGVADPDFSQVKDDGGGSTGVFAYAFDASTDEEIFFAVPIKHTYKEDSDITAYIRWSPSDANAGNVVWALEYTWANAEGTFGNTTIITVTDAADGTAAKHQRVAFSAISGSSKDISGYLLCRLYRDADNAADTYASDAHLISFEINYELNTMGSKTATSK